MKQAWVLIAVIVIAAILLVGTIATAQNDGGKPVPLPTATMLWPGAGRPTLVIVATIEEITEVPAGESDTIPFMPTPTVTPRPPYRCDVSSVTGWKRVLFDMICSFQWG